MTQPRSPSSGPSCRPTTRTPWPIRSSRPSAATSTRSSGRPPPASRSPTGCGCWPTSGRPCRRASTGTFHCERSERQCHRERSERRGDRERGDGFPRRTRIRARTTRREPDLGGGCGCCPRDPDRTHRRSRRVAGGHRPGVGVGRPGARAPHPPAPRSGLVVGIRVASMTAVVLASASPARLGVLRAAGIDPVVAVSDVDETVVLATVADDTPDVQVGVLAAAKADTVATSLPRDVAVDCVVIGCDSMLLIDGELQGKPNGADQARERWARMGGREGVLLTGHAVRRVTSGRPTAGAVGTRSTVVRMGVPTPAELSAYISTGEPLAVAGALTIDGYGGWFVDSVDGDPSNVIGISLPLTRRLLADVGIAVTDLWRTA